MLQTKQKPQDTYSALLTKLEERAKDIHDGSGTFPDAVWTAAGEFSEAEMNGDSDVALGLLNLAESDPHPEWRNHCHDYSEPADVLNTLALSAIVSDVLSHTQ